MKTTKLTKNEFCKRYLNLISSDLSGLNLTRITEPKEFEVKQYDDSIIVFHLILNDLIRNDGLKTLVDIGFGGGFPLLPIANEHIDLNVVGIDARSKKVNAVQLIANKMTLYNVSTIHSRIDEVFIDKKCLITLKAVGSIQKFLPQIHTLTGSYIAFYKGPKYREERPDELSIIENQGWELIDEFNYQLRDNSERFLVLIKKINVPRGTKLKKSTKKLVNMSQLIKNQ